MQGGGHGPAAHNFGLGADQVLEAQVCRSPSLLLPSDHVISVSYM